MRADRESVTRLLKTARGQLDGLLKMVEDDRYCMDISNQLLATQAILKKANRQILQAHLQGCVQEAIGHEAAEEKIGEIVALLEKIDR
ncbi:MAG: metal-sensing transcriptional repressor [Christensenellaceae bacterium]|nr:metal-sensing transcriptional repressor [Christensenellaceae bacterium]